MEISIFLGKISAKPHKVLNGLMLKNKKLCNQGLYPLMSHAKRDGRSGKKIKKS